MKNAAVVLLLLVFFAVRSEAQNYYWVAFTDKNNSVFSLSDPEEYLSERAVQRRKKQNIPIDSLDLPVNSNYIDSVLSLGAELVHASKWLNGVTVKTGLDSLDEKIMHWSFVKEVQLSKPSLLKKSTRNKFDEKESVGEVPIDTSVYGESAHQVGMLNGQFLHSQGYKGQGMHIAVLDAGFYKTDEFLAFDSLWANGQILGVRDFVSPGSDIFETHYHGMSVLSCMGGNVPGKLIGTAPDASYWLLRSEDANSEYIIEEDNWVVAAEFADSAGADIINSSLGYYLFDDPATDHSYADMDGKTTRVTRAANIAASRGMLVFSSAGNEGNDPWKHIIAPSDGDRVIGVGAVKWDSTPAPFTSYGPAYDGDVKPNVSAVGYMAIAQKNTGSIGYINGTSFSSPIMAGMAACLWQMFPNRKAGEIKEAIELSGHNYNSPDSLLGYGIPDMQLAAAWLENQSVGISENLSGWSVYPNPVKDYIVLQSNRPVQSNTIDIQLIDLGGRVLKRWVKPASGRVVLTGLPASSPGIHLLRISANDFSETFKLSKIR